ncbi:uncharacterized protein LOC111386276 [Olea europaea var. sylvestris]|uniref:uncharacterized protein LOC111386276 n=1 Tax=Olea europaea var. sylvestris TaxID=158386 RepID=UPI000C1D7F64|nr:uncharacterized protein LOC111386276 [Olea europaea var. sylvestris]
MANPRRISYSNSSQLPISEPINQFQSQTPQTAANLLNSLKFFLKKPHAVPFLLSFLLFLTWVSLRFQRYSSNPSFHQSAYDSNGVALHGGYDKYSDANIVKFPSFSPIVMKDKRGWLINPVSLALDAAITGIVQMNNLETLFVGIYGERKRNSACLYILCNDKVICSL